MRRMRIIEKGANSPTREEAATTPDLRYSFQSTGRFSIMSAISCGDRALSTELPVHLFRIKAVLGDHVLRGLGGHIARQNGFGGGNGFLVRGFRPVNPNLKLVGQYKYSGGRLPFSVFFVFGPSLLRGETCSLASSKSISALTRIILPLPPV